MINTGVINRGTSTAKTVKLFLVFGREKRRETKTYLDKREPISKIITRKEDKNLFMKFVGPTKTDEMKSNLL